MINKLRSLAIFATVVDQGTFRGAGRHLDLAPSRISETVSKLEKELGVTLLYRSTRRLSLTDQGRTLYVEAKNMLAAAENGLDAIRPMSGEPSGHLRITAPAFLTQGHVMDAFAAFAKAHPKVRLDLDFSDHRRDLIRDGYDVAVRAGVLEDSELLSRSVGTAKRMVVTSPDYYASRSKPRHPEDLEDWNWVRFSLRSEKMELYGSDGEAVSVVGRSHIVVDSASALYELVLRGLGVTVLPEDLASRACHRGDLVSVLPSWAPRALGLYVVWPDRSPRENLTKIFVRFLAERQLGRARDPLP